jgi:hypothetical protein
MMPQIAQHESVGEASDELLDFILLPENWVALSELPGHPELRPGQNALYQRKVGNLRICASVDVSDELKVFLRIGFRSPGLTPVKAADHLEQFLQQRLPLVPNTEWQVEVDPRGWIHFMRPYQGAALRA